jgi:catechol 2,3-dioxygenase-like lactoylglutathione lyase family enzyme
MFRPKLIHHVNIQINDRERTSDWYTKVLGAEFLDRGPALNRRQLQLRLGVSEIHFTERPQPSTIPSSHFALEVDDWNGMLARLDELGIAHVRTSAASTMQNIRRHRPPPGPPRGHRRALHLYSRSRREPDRAGPPPARARGLPGAPHRANARRSGASLDSDPRLRRLGVRRTPRLTRRRLRPEA